MQKIIEKKQNLDHIYALAEQAKEAGDIDQAINLSEKGLKEAELQKDSIWLPKFELFTREMHIINSDMHPSEVAVIVKNKNDITKLKGIGPSIAQNLHDAGYNNIEQLSMCNPKILSQVKGIGSETAKKFIHLAKEYIGVSHIPSIQSTESINQQQNLSEYTESENVDTNTTSFKKETEELKQVNASKPPWFEKKFSFRRGTRSYPRIKKPQASQVDFINTKSPAIEPVDDSDIHLIEEEEEEIQEEILEEEYLSEIVEKQNIKSLKKGIKELAGKIKTQPSVSLDIKPKQNKEKVITKVAMNLEPKKEVVLSKLRAMIINTAKTEAFEIIPKDTKEFKNILRKIDVTLFKIFSSDNSKNILLVCPIKINPVQDVLVVSEEEIKYLTFSEKNLLLDAYIADLRHIPSIILENLVKNEETLQFFQSHFIYDISMDQSISDEISLYSGAAQFKVYVNPILISDEHIQFIEKSLPFAYQRSSGVHFIHMSQLPKLLYFLEKKYQAIKEHSEEESDDQNLDQIQDTTCKNILISSIPFIGFGIFLISLGLVKLEFILQSFIGLSYGIIGIYVVLIGFLWYKYHIKYQKVQDQLLTPFHQRPIKLDNTSLEIIYQELSDENMLQFGYECFGKIIKHKLLNNIEEQRAEQYSVEKVHDNYYELFEQEADSKYNEEFGDFLND